MVLYVGGNYNQNQNYGAFYLNGNNQASNQNANIGSHILTDIWHNTTVNPLHRAINIGYGLRAALAEDNANKGQASTSF